MLRGDGVDLHLTVWPGEGKPVLCIHGLTANCRNWDSIAGALMPDHLVMAVDLRGRGHSEQPPSGYDIDHHCRDIENLVRDLGLESLALMGHSLGAIIALAFAVKHPEQVERVILVDGGAQLSKSESEKIIQSIGGSLARLGKVFPSFEIYCESIQKAAYLQPWLPSMNVFFKHDVEVLEEGVRSRIQATAIEQELSNLQKFDVSELYPQVCCPVLILRAANGMQSQDAVLISDAALEKMLDEIEDARCVDIQGVNHYTIMFQDSKRRDQAIRAFLSGQPLRCRVRST